VQIAHTVVKRMRWNKGWSQAELATHADVSEHTVRKMEGGGYSPRPSTAKKVAEALGCQVSDITVDDDGIISGAVGQAAASV
jgi:DNA-binding XRE family transcriptional regulator